VGYEGNDAPSRPRSAKIERGGYDVSTGEPAGNIELKPEHFKNLLRVPSDGINYMMCRLADEDRALLQEVRDLLRYMNPEYGKGNSPDECAPKN
jgi:hypothetical protein